jgi:transposase-like protein
MTKIPSNRKRCPRCKKIKDRASGFTHRSNGTIFSWCKQCNKDYQRERKSRARQEVTENVEQH